MASLSGLRTWPTGTVVAQAVGVLLLAAVAGALVARGFAVPVAVAALALALGAVFRQVSTRPGVPLLALAVAALPPPAVFPMLVGLGGRNVYVTDLLLPAGALIALLRASRTPRSDRTMWAYVWLFVSLTLLSLIRFVPLDSLIQDLRGPIYIVCGYLIASRLYEETDAGRVVATAAAVLWYTAVMIAASLVTGAELLSGRVNDGLSAFTVTGTAEVDAGRFLLDAKGLAYLGVVVGLTALLSPSWPRRRLTLLGLGLPGLIATFAALSRQSFVALAVSVLVLLALGGRLRLDARRTAVASSVVVVVVFALAAAWSGVSSPAGNVVARQLYAFEVRVVQGLFPENAAQSPGNQWRLVEARYALEAFRGAPVLGVGVGEAYRPLAGEQVFGDADYGARFIHNLWLYYVAKTGAVGVAVFLVFLLVPTVGALRQPLRDRQSVVDVALVAGLVGLAVVNVFEPDFHRVGTAPLLGALLGYLALRASRQAPGRRSRRMSSPATGRTTSRSLVRPTTE